MDKAVTHPWRVSPPGRIGAYAVRAASNELAGPAGVVRLRPRLMDVLLRLAMAPGEVVTRQALLAEVWPRRMVADEVLSRTIAELRTALGDDPRSARYIETIPTVGYRLVAVCGDIPAAIPGSPLPDPRVAARTGRGRWLAGAAIGVALVAGLAWWRGFAPDPVRALERQLAAATPLTADPDLEVNPRFSPDGNSVIYVAGPEGTRDSRIVIQDLAGKVAPTGFGSSTDILASPAFFPDGKRIAYLHCVVDDECRIVGRDLASGAETTLVDAAARPLPGFDIAPDGNALVYATRLRPQFPHALALADLVTGQRRALTAPEPGMGNDRRPRFAPDGRRVAFFRGTDSQRRLWILDVAAPERAAATALPRGQTYGAAWLDNHALLVAADWFGFRALNRVDLAGGTAALVGARGARYPDVHRNGAIVYENAVFRADLWLFDPAVAQRAPVALWPSTRYTNQPEFSRDGRQLVFVSNRDGAEALYVGTPGGALRRLTADDGYRYIRPHWSRDGRSVLAIRMPIGIEPEQHAVRIDVADGRVAVLDALGSNVFDAREDDEGRFLYFGELVEHAARLSRAPLSDLGARERLPLPPASEYAIDATRLAFTQPQLAGLTVCTLPALKCEPLPLPIGDTNRFDWALAPGGIWFLDPGGAAPTLARYDSASGKVGARSAFAPTGFGRSIAVAPDGTLVVGREAPLAIDLMLAR